MANPNVIVFGSARFTFFSATLLRLQLQGIGSPGWDLRPSLSMPYSAPPLAPVGASVSYTGLDTVVVATAGLRLTYNKSSPGITAANTAVELLSAPHTAWAPGADPAGNLGGTRLDLGCYDSFAACYSNGLGWGPLSRAGWAVWDDGHSARWGDVDPALGFAWFDTRQVRKRQAHLTPNKSRAAALSKGPSFFSPLGPLTFTAARVARTLAADHGRRRLVPLWGGA